MPDDGPTSERLDSLRARSESGNESDSRSGIFLQLADEYRRLGRTEDAVAVLEERIAQNPNHPAALVALGRCRLELGRFAEATEVLERVIASDPTQMVAYRLLVEAYVERGMAEEARQRMRVYSLLNDADPEIAELRRRIGEIERRRRGESPYLEAGVEDAPDALLDAAEPAEPAPAGGGDPFPHLDDPSGRRRYLEALASGGLFAVEEPDDLEETKDEAAAEPAEPAEPAELPVRSELSDDLFGLGGAAAAPGPDLSALLDGGYFPSTEIEPAAEPGLRSEPAPAPTATPQAPPADDRGGRPTVTLGRLYLRQGHREEAATIFRQVLGRDPDSAEAQAELAALEEDAREAGAPAITAADLLADWDGARDAEGTTARKRHVLERYLDRIRGRSERDVH